MGLLLYVYDLECSGGRQTHTGPAAATIGVEYTKIILTYMTDGDKTHWDISATQ